MECGIAIGADARLPAPSAAREHRPTQNRHRAQCAVYPRPSGGGQWCLCAQWCH